ncbi:Crp/Fnr family transcriptional regulator [Pedobacter heparinus]|uniref:Crp/Fnr family transcriptional regulator n=1 Tax=Pedobacter heparinus TaxID=984 RepID=UPI00292E73D4|nr:Crp/Fnr family transcriptional regulator [Pedobacter heparinus]
MLNNKNAFARLMALLCSIDPAVPLPDELEDYLWQHMIVEAFCSKSRVLENEGAVPAKAYYVVRGFVMVYGFDIKLDRYVMRIYRENTIVALNCFMKQTVSVFTIVACKDTLVWSISDARMKEIYEDMPGMETMALSTALKYSDGKEAARAKLLAMEVEERVFHFYNRYIGLLPPRKSPIKDKCVACFLNVSVGVLRRVREKLKTQGLLNF